MQVVTQAKIQHCFWQFKILHESNHHGLLQKVTQMWLKHLYPWFKSTFFRTLVEKNPIEFIGRWKESVERMEKNVLFNKVSDKVMRLKDKENRFIIVIQQTDREKANRQIKRSSFLKIEYDPTTLYINKVKELTIKWISRNGICCQWKCCTRKKQYTI